MSRTLIICVDRDDDIGRKVGMATPIIGRDASLDVANRLAIADPEDTDLNTIFGGIQVYDELSSSGDDVEIVLLSGDVNVGIKSDRKIAAEFDDLLSKMDVDSAIVVTDGAEDEAVLPIIQSRVKVNSVKRVIVQQNPGLESTYYQIKQAFKDPKIARSFLVPTGLGLLVYALGLFVGRPESAIATTTIVLAVYILFKGFGLDDVLDDFTDSMQQSLYGGRIAFITYVTAVVFVIIGTMMGIIGAWTYYTQPVMAGYVTLAMMFVNDSIWWYVGAGLLSGLGRMIDTYLEDKQIWRHIPAMFFFLASGIILWGSSKFILSMYTELIPPMEGVQILIFSIISAILIALVGTWVSSYVKEHPSAGKSVEAE